MWRGGGDWDIDFNNGQMFLQGSTGFLGIGTISPDELLEIENDTGSQGADPITIKLNSITNRSDWLNLPFAQIDFASNDTSGIGVGTKARIASLVHTGTNGGNIGLAFSTSTTGGGSLSEQMRITDIGNVGIGTVVPTRKLEVALTTGGILSLNRADTSIVSTNTLGALHFQGDDPSAGTIRSGGFVAGIADGTWVTNDYPGKLEFATTASGASSPTVRVTIKESGNVGIGTATPSSLLQVNGGFETEGERLRKVETFTDTGTMADTSEVAVGNKATVHTLTLPTHKVDKTIWLFNKGAGTWTISPTSGNIGAGATATLLQHESLFLMSDGTNWLV